ncbi:MAG: MBL fold metallo-hydrolase [Planctomycetota bacterium]|nr:MBL fold metallo-hydrolase [Planctomycetota bacterium]
MNMSRRSFSRLTLAVAAAGAAGPMRGALARRADEPGRYFDWVETAAGAKVATGGGGNVLLVMSRGESLLVDCKNPGLGATLRREAESYGSPLAAVVNTHHHRDHVGGNSAFAGDVPLWAHARSKERIEGQIEGLLQGGQQTLKQMEASEKPVPRAALEEARRFVEGIAGLQPSSFAPTKLVEAAEETVTLPGGLSARLVHFGPGHTDNDLVVHLPSLNMVHTGDLLFHKRHPFIDFPAGATIEGWKRSLKEINALCDEGTVVVPGHGDLTGRGALQEQADYFDAMIEIVEAARAQGKTREEVIALKPERFAGYGHEQLLPRVLGALFDAPRAD